MTLFSAKTLYGSADHKALLLVAAFAIPALYINLGMLPLKGDESIRAVVTLEMMISGDYITPTINGEIYLNKPPLFNWILAVFFRLFHNNSEFMVRFPTTLFLIIYSFVIFWFVKKQLGKQLAVLSSLAFLTCGRILFWDSYLGLIDIFYSMLMFTNFMVIWQMYHKNSFTWLFLISWLLCSAGFLLKGIPTLAFQGITLLIVSIQHKSSKPLFSIGNITGALLFLIITGTYYFFYSLRNPGYLDNALMRLLTESTDKSAIGNGFGKTTLHLFTFPFELINHFLPWVLLVIFIFHKRILKKLISNDFIRYCLMVFAGNILIYWFSPTTYPRYLLMLMPLAFIITLYAGKFHEFTDTVNYRIVKAIILFFIIGLSVASVIMPLMFSKQLPVHDVLLKSAMIAGFLGIVYLLSVKGTVHSGLFFYLALVLLISRISFDLFLMPYRESKDWVTVCRTDAIEAGRGTRGNALYFMSDTMTIHNLYYITRERNEILKRGKMPESGPYYIIDDTTEYKGFRKEYSMRVPYHYKTFYVGKFTQTTP
jgi:4-amino-4-deoxy-L-arabinose transferase-like glycosyltransferase